jgi:outer membrane protein assembly factor BamB
MSMLPFSIPRVNPALIFSALLLPEGVSSPVAAADWPRYRGPNLDGISTEAGLRTSGEAKVLWSASVGLGYGAAVVGGGKVIVSGHDGKDRDTVFCFDEATGKEVWKHSYPQPLGDLYFQGGTTGTATIEGNRVYQLAREGELFCLELASGKVVWQKNLAKDFEYSKPDWGFTGAPLVWDDWLFLNAGDSGLCLKKGDGSVIWKSKDEVAGYSTPYPVTRDGWRLVVFSNKRSYVCVDASNGTEVWRHKWMTRYGVNAADPIILEERVFISSGYGKGATLLEWKEKGALKDLWENREMQAQMNAPVLIDGHLYGISGNEGQDGTGLRCLEFASGEVEWSEPSVGHGAAMAVGKQLLVLTEGGELLVGEASPSGFKPTFRQKVLEPKIWTVPVFANGRVYCRNAAGKLVVVDMKADG